MKNKLTASLILLLTAIALTVFEFIYIKDSSSTLSDIAEEMSESIKNDDYSTASKAFEEFKEMYFKREKIISLLVHDNVIDEIHDMINRIGGLLETETKDELIPEVEALTEKLHDLYECILPDLRNIM